MYNKFTDWCSDHYEHIMIGIILFGLFIFIIGIVNVFNINEVKVVNNIPTVPMKIDGVMESNIAGAYKIECLKGREIITIYSKSFKQTEFVYTGKCDESK